MSQEKTPKTPQMQGFRRAPLRGFEQSRQVPGIRLRAESGSTSGVAALRGVAVTVAISDLLPTAVEEPRRETVRDFGPNSARRNSIRETREGAGLSIEELAAASYVPAAVLRRIGENEPINGPALCRMLEQIIANNRAGGWRKLKQEG